jgi:hypothetical protein
MYKLLEAIGVISKATQKKAEGKSASYQDSVTASLAREDDDDWEDDDEEVEDDEETANLDTAQGSEKLKSVSKVRNFKYHNIFTSHIVIQLHQIISSIRGSPQRRQEWVKEVQASTAFKDGKLGKQPLMPILDVRTRWSSTHQMLRMNFICRTL